MKVHRYKAVIPTLLLFFVAGQLAFGQVERSKKVEKIFKVNSATLISIQNKYGEIHANTWDKPEVDLKVEVIVTKRNEREAMDYLDRIEIDIDESSSELSIQTEISGNINNRKGESMEINYVVSLPASNNLDMKHSYGSLFLDDMDGEVDLKMSYGNMKVGNLNANSIVKLSYGNGEIQNMKDGELSVGYSNLTIDETGNVEMSSQYSNVEIRTVKDMEMSNRYGSLKIEEINNLKGSSKYGNLELEKLYNSVVLDLVHGGGVKVEWISKDFNRIDLDISYSSGTVLRFERGFGAELDARFKYSDLKYSEDDFEFSYVSKENTSNEYKGRIGGNGNGQIKIESDYGGVRIGYSRLD